MSYRGNVAKVEADAEVIVNRLLAGAATVCGICREYRCGYRTLMRVYIARTTPDQREAVRKRALSRGGIANRFKKGHVPWNKGVKGIHLSPATEFKAGGLRGQAARNWRPIGTVTTRTDKPKRRRGPGRPPKRRSRQRWIKIKDDGRLQDRWIPLTRWFWQRANGPVPAGSFIVHADGDTMNDSPDNLRLVDNRGHLALLLARDPSMEQRCRAAAGKAALHRHRMDRSELHKARGPVATRWQCHGCGADFGRRPEQCPKCGGCSFERIAVTRTEMIA